MAFLSWLRSALSRELPAPARTSRVESSLPWQRWTDEERERVKRQIEAISPDALTEDDCVKMAEFVIQRYLPEDTRLKTQADYDRVLDKLRATIRRNAEMTPEERTKADEEARARIDPKFADWLDVRLSRVGTRTLGTPGSWNPSTVKPAGIDEEGFEVYRHTFDIEMMRESTTVTVETTAQHLWPNIIAYIHDPEDGPDKRELTVIRMRWMAFGKQAHVSRIAVEEAVIRGHIGRHDAPVPGPDHESYLEALNATIRELEKRWPGSTPRPHSIRLTAE